LFSGFGSISGEVASNLGASKPALGKAFREGHVGTITQEIPGAVLPQSLLAQQNLPRVIQLPKQILLHLEVSRISWTPYFFEFPSCAGNSEESRFNICCNLN
jgi:hypothetical protein